MDDSLFFQLMKLTFSSIEFRGMAYYYSLISLGIFPIYQACYVTYQPKFSSMNLQTYQKTKPDVESDNFLKEILIW
jgi:hypothetical protein